MTVGELIEYLKEFNPDMQVILQKDAEGNGYSPLCGAGEAIYVAVSTYSGECYELDWTADDCCMDEEEHAELMNRPHSLVLFPIN